MAKHKAATEVTIAQEEKSGFAEAVFRYKWPALTALAVAAAAILYVQSASEAATESARAEWSKLYDAQNEDDKLAALSQATGSMEDPQVRAWAYLNMALLQLDEGDYEGASASLELARQSAPEVLATLQFPIGPDDTNETLIDHLARSVGEEAAWTEAHPFILENPPLPEGSPRVELTTDLGSIVLGLDLEAAPLHAKNFMALVEEGYYDGIRFHRIMPGAFIQGGDPNSRDEDDSTWGLGGPETTISPEDTKLIHTEGVLAAAKKGGAVNSSGSQFYLTASRQHQFDGNYVVYGRVLEGLDLVREISNAEQRETKAETPAEPVTIISAKML